MGYHLMVVAGFLFDFFLSLYDGNPSFEPPRWDSSGKGGMVYGLLSVSPHWSSSGVR